MTGTFEIELTVDDDQGKRLVAGFIAKIKIDPSQKQKHALVPIGSIVEGNGDEGTVFTVDESSSRAVRRVVEIVHILGESVAISSGLEGTDRVVSTGAAYLEDGSLVEITGKDPPAVWE
jgi:multidrug efflux pump subunit AcrA (membrane-fusion protein)